MVDVKTTVGVQVEEDLYDIRTKSRNVVIDIECDGKESWVSLLGELRTTQRMDQWLDWITKPPYGEDAPNTNWLIAVLTISKKNDGRPDPGIN